jgi:hypothetical protein
VVVAVQLEEQELVDQLVLGVVELVLMVLATLVVQQQQTLEVEVVELEDHLTLAEQVVQVSWLRERRQAQELF